MKWLIVCAALLASIRGLGAQEAPSSKWIGDLKNLVPAVPGLSMPNIPSMPSVGMPDFSQMAEDFMREFNVFTTQVGESVPILEEMGYEVATFRVQWGLPPKAKLRLRSKGLPDPNKATAIAQKATGGMLIKALISSAAEAKRIQSNMKLGTAILDVDLSMTPKVRMSFLKGTPSREPVNERDVQDLDLACGQALN